MSDVCGNCELCTMTVERSETCYFDRYDTSGAWDNPANVVDDDIVSYGYFMTQWAAAVDYWKPPNSVINCDSISCSTPTDITRTITKVELRGASLSTQIGSGCDFTVHAILEPVFTAGVGDEHAYLTTYVPEDLYAAAYPTWSNWLDITTDTNAPGTWTWTDVGSLEVNHFPRYTSAAGCGNPCYLMTHMIQIRVTWNESVQMYFPRTIDGGLSKNIDIFNLWEVIVKTRDSGLNNQPFRFNGTMMPICTGGGVILCFPLCFPLCFEEGAGATINPPTVFQTIHEWIENHDEVTISCYGDCADGKYIIKHFATHSMRSPDYYGYDLILEKVSD